MVDFFTNCIVFRLSFFNLIVIGMAWVGVSSFEVHLFLLELVLRCIYFFWN